jgi:hypothetical protein
MNILVGVLVMTAMPGIAFAGTPAAAPAPAQAPLDDPAPPARPAPPQAAPQPPAPQPAMPQPYAPPPPPAPQGQPPAGLVAPQGYPPPGAYPAYPAYPAPSPGYYPPPAYPPAYAPPAYFTAQKLVVLDAEIRDLSARRDAIGFGGPLVLLIGGAALGIAGIAVISANSCSTYDYREYDSYYACQEAHDDEQSMGAFMLLAGATGVTIGIISSIIRGAKRRHLARQIYARQSEANALRSLHPRWGVIPKRDGGALSLAFSF